MRAEHRGPPMPQRELRELPGSFLSLRKSGCAVTRRWHAAHSSQQALNYGTCRDHSLDADIATLLHPLGSAILLAKGRTPAKTSGCGLYPPCNPCRERERERGGQRRGEGQSIKGPREREPLVLAVEREQPGRVVAVEDQNSDVPLRQLLEESLPDLVSRSSSSVVTQLLSSHTSLLSCLLWL